MMRNAHTRTSSRLLVRLAHNITITSISLALFLTIQEEGAHGFIITPSTTSNFAKGLHVPMQVPVPLSAAAAAAASNSHLRMPIRMSMQMLPYDKVNLDNNLLTTGPSLLLLAQEPTNTYDPSSMSATGASVSVEGLSPTANTIVFIIGIIPFLWATYEFWSRIAVGASFGTGSDSIQIRPSSTSTPTSTSTSTSTSTTRTIGQDGNPIKSRGQQVLGDDALLVAYVLFAIAIGSVGIAVYSVLSSTTPPPSLPLPLPSDAMSSLP